MTPETLDYIARVTGGIVKMTGMIRTDTQEALKGDHIGLITHFDQARRVNEQIKEARKALDEIVEDLSHDKVPNAMREAKVKTLTLEGIGRISVSSRFSCSMLDKSAGHNWLKANELGDIIIPTVNAQTLASTVKEWMAKTGEDLPDDIFKTSNFDYTSITKK